MEKQLTIREATVQTVQIEIKALKVGKKQVTMGLFRQLPHTTLLDPDTVQFRGVPWGYVNYWWDGDGAGFGRGEKLHVVWQLGERLHRAVVYQEPDPNWMSHFRSEQQALMNAWLLLRLAEAEQFEMGKNTWGEKRDITIDGRKFMVNFEQSEWYAIEHYWHWRMIDPMEVAERSISSYQRAIMTAGDVAEALAKNHAYQCEQKADALARYDALLDARGFKGRELQSVQEDIQQVQNARRRYQALWESQWEVLNQLPQLFIAV